MENTDLSTIMEDIYSISCGNQAVTEDIFQRVLDSQKHSDTTTTKKKYSKQAASGFTLAPNTDH